MNKRNRIDDTTRAWLLYGSIITDCVKGVLDLTIIGIPMSFLLGVSAYIFNLFYLQLKGVSMMERAFPRFIIFFIFGAFPGSTTIGTAFTVVLTRRDDARYNELQVKNMNTRV